MTNRIPCIVPGCRHTAPAEKYEPGTRIICGKCWKLLPTRMTARYRTLRRRGKVMDKMIARRAAKGLPVPTQQLIGQIDRLMDANWREIEYYFTAQPAPAGLENFLNEIGLN